MIENSALTGGALQEAGLFEELMRSFKSHLQAEYDADRIKGADYANVYLGSATAALQTATQFVLSKELTNQQILLTQEQVLGQQKQNALIDAQITKLAADTLISTKQLELMDEQKALTIQQTAKTTQDVLNVAKQVEIGTKNIQVMDSQIAQSTAQTSMIGNQELNVIAEKANIAKVGLKLDAEKDILAQKKFTEEAQTKDIVNGVSVAGILGAQAELYAKQTAGYDRDAEQKAAKIYADFYNINRSTDPDILPDSYGADGANVTSVLNILKAGI